MWVSIVYFLFVIMSLDLLHGDINVKPTIQTLKCIYCVQSGRGRNIKSFLPFGAVSFLKATLRCT